MPLGLPHSSFWLGCASDFSFLIMAVSARWHVLVQVSLVVFCCVSYRLCSLCYLLGRFVISPSRLAFLVCISLTALNKNVLISPTFFSYCVLSCPSQRCSLWVFSLPAQERPLFARCRFRCASFFRFRSFFFQPKTSPHPVVTVFVFFCAGRPHAGAPQKRTEQKNGEVRIR